MLTRHVMYSWTFGLALLIARTTLAKHYLDVSRTITETPQSTTERFTFILEKDGLYPYYDLAIQMTQGRVDLRILDPAGRNVTRTGARVCTVPNQPIPDATSPGTYTVEITTTDAIGQWHLRIYGGPAPPRPSLGPGLASAGAMMLVAMASVWFWRRRSGVAWRWFWVGAALWAVAVAVKFAIAIPLNKPVLEGGKALSPHWAYLTTGTIYGGVMTGITEILFTLIAALIWRQMAASAARGVAVGVGAGAFEAALLAVVAAIGPLVAGGSGPTWSIALAPAAERVTTILCHVASRGLVLLAVARRRLAIFWYGFLLLSGVDAVAMFFSLTGRADTLSPWTMEALIAPFGLASIPITIWCIRRWPAMPDAPDSQERYPVEMAGQSKVL